MNCNLPTYQLDNHREQSHALASEREMINYFLGNLPAEQEQKLEEQFFADDQLFDQMQSIKEQLIDNYLHQKLSKEDLALFERNFLSSPPQRKQVEFARSLMNSISKRS